MARPSQPLRRSPHMEQDDTQRSARRLPKRRRSTHLNTQAALCALLASLPASLAQSCISLADSITCPAFNASSISTDSTLVGLFPFLSSVTDLSSFDSGLQDYVGDGFAQLRYSTLIGCSNFDSGNTTDYYARYTTSVICNAIVQNSITACDLSGNAARPLCADSCATYAQSEEEIVASNICGNADSGALTQIRADFTNCALPTDSLTGTCVEAYQNEPDNCGFQSNLGGLCSYCSASSPNSTDSCCVFSNTTSRCTGVTLPIIASSALQAVTVTDTSSSSSGTSSPSLSSTFAAVAHRGLSAGEIAGIAVGAILGALVLLGLLIGACLLMRRRRDRSPATSVFNQPITTRGQPMAYAEHDGAHDSMHQDNLPMLGGGRVARMSALEGGDTSNSEHTNNGGGYNRKSNSDEDYTPEHARALGLAPPPKRSGSLSSGSQLAIQGQHGHENYETSPSTNADFTSPESFNNNGSPSERLRFFKDYYSQDEIHASDVVSTLWAYEPRAADEFHLERGDMIKVIGIWDDGWATGVRIRQNAEDWRPDDKLQRDSGMSNGSGSATPGDGEGEVKAFPLVCVCLPQHWRRTIEGESTEESSEGARQYSELP